MADSRDGDDDPFTILGVSRTCTPSELKQVYRELARRYHPDVNPGPEAAAQMKRINLAYDRALTQLERAIRLRAARASAMTVATQRQQPPPAGLAQVFGQGVRIARSAAPRRGRRGRLWLSLVGSVALVALVALLVIHAVRLSSSPMSTGAGAHGASLPILRLGGSASFSWRDSGAVTITERLIGQLPPDVRLNEAPQWSSDGDYVAMSVAPVGSTGATANEASTILVMRGFDVLSRIPGTSARWSPAENQLAVLTGPGGANAPLLELVSPLSSSIPTVLDTNAATHLTWSDDGTQIAYSAKGQQQLRVTSVVRVAPRMLDKEPGERHIPLGWQGGQIVEIVHKSGAVSLVRVDAADKQKVTLANLDSLATETTVVVSQRGIAYLSQPGTSPFVTLNWLALASQQLSSVPLSGIQSVRFLAGWSADGDWVALASATSSDTSAGTSEICLAHAPHPQTTPPTSWPLHCLPIPGVVEGMSWEPRGSTLSYAREAQPGAPLEFRALHIQSSSARGASAQADSAPQRSAGSSPPAGEGLGEKPVGIFSIITEGSRRHYCGVTQHRPTPFSVRLADQAAIPHTPTG